MRILSHYVSAYQHIQFLTQWKITNAIFVDANFKQNAAALQYWSDMFQPNSRNIVDPTQLIGYDSDQKVHTNNNFYFFFFGGLFFVQNCNILLLERCCNSFHALLFPALSGVEMKMYERSSQAVFFFSHPSHWCLLSRAALAWLLATPPNGQLARRLI